MLGSLITPSRVKLNLESTEWDECFSELLEVMIENNPKIVRTQAISALVQREEKMSTAVFPSVAVPHATCNSVNETQTETEAGSESSSQWWSAESESEAVAE